MLCVIVKSGEWQGQSKRSKSLSAGGGAEMRDCLEGSRGNCQERLVGFHRKDITRLRIV